MTTADLTTSSGPIGKQRGPVIVCLLLFIPFYALFWVYTQYKDVKAHTGEGIGGPLGLLIAILSANLVTIFLLPTEINRMFARDGQASPVSWKTAFWVLLFVFPWYFKIQKAANQYWASKGAPV